MEIQRVGDQIVWDVPEKDVTIVTSCDKSILSIVYAAFFYFVADN